MLREGEDEDSRYHGGVKDEEDDGDRKLTSGILPFWARTAPPQWSLMTG